MKKRNYFNIHIIITIAAVFCMITSGCSSTANTSDSAAIVDTTKPVITVSKKELSVAVGDEEWSKSVAKNFKVVDDTDGNLKEVEKIEDGKAGYVVDDDKIDPTKAGTYTVSVTAVDSAGNKAKSSFSVKVTENKEKAETETESKETEKAESKSESSSGNSSATNSSSTSNSSASSSNSGSSSSASKPSTGSSSSSGSSTGSGSSASSGSSGSSGGSTVKPTTPTCKDVVVVDREAYDEQVLVKEAYDETILVKEAWDEPYAYVIQCVQCGTEFPFQLGDQDSLESAVNAWDLHALATGCENNRDITKYIHHDAEYQTVHHDAEYQTVHHDAVTHVVKVCS